MRVPLLLLAICLSLLTFATAQCTSATCPIGWCWEGGSGSFWDANWCNGTNGPPQTLPVSSISGNTAFFYDISVLVAITIGSGSVVLADNDTISSVRFQSGIQLNVLAGATFTLKLSTSLRYGGAVYIYGTLVVDMVSARFNWGGGVHVLAGGLVSVINGSVWELDQTALVIDAASSVDISGSGTTYLMTDTQDLNVFGKVTFHEGTIWQLEGAGSSSSSNAVGNIHPGGVVTVIGTATNASVILAPYTGNPIVVQPGGTLNVIGNVTETFEVNTFQCESPNIVCDAGFVTNATSCCPLGCNAQGSCNLPTTLPPSSASVAATTVAASTSVAALTAVATSASTLTGAVTTALASASSLATTAAAATGAAVSVVVSLSLLIAALIVASMM